MAMTGLVKDELSRVTVLKPCCRKAEVSTLLRFAGGLHLAGGRIVVEAELDTGAAARRLRKDVSEVFGHASELIVLAPSGLRKGNRYVVRVRKDGESLARQTGLVDSHGRPVRGLPRSHVHWVEPQLVAQVGFSEWTTDGELRHPRFQGLRRDKDPAEVVREMP